jgi:hypothetical protein
MREIVVGPDKSTTNAAEEISVATIGVARIGAARIGAATI